MHEHCICYDITLHLNLTFVLCRSLSMLLRLWGCLFCFTGQTCWTLIITTVAYQWQMLVPPYISDLLNFKRSSSYSLRSSKEQLLSPPNCKTLVTLGNRAKLWNVLPKDVRNAETVDSFKRLLKSHLFKWAFYCSNSI